MNASDTQPHGPAMRSTAVRVRSLEPSGRVVRVGLGSRAATQSSSIGKPTTRGGQPPIPLSETTRMESPVARLYKHRSKVSDATGDCVYNSNEKHDVTFSAVIPTWNEEEWLPGLLSNLQRFPQIVEIIVADNWSVDQTRTIARSYGARVVSGGYPAVARNKGTEYATSDFILFIDADAAVTGAVLRARNTILLNSPGRP